MFTITFTSLRWPIIADPMLWCLAKSHNMTISERISMSNAADVNENDTWTISGEDFMAKFMFSDSPLLTGQFRISYSYEKMRQQLFTTFVSVPYMRRKMTCTDCTKCDCTKQLASVSSYHHQPQDLRSPVIQPIHQFLQNAIQFQY
jgi:hypothetical protein